jgi:hypothetical protein
MESMTLNGLSNGQIRQLATEVTERDGAMTGIEGELQTG